MRVESRYFLLPSVKRTRSRIGLLVSSARKSIVQPTHVVRVTTNFVNSGRRRKIALFIGLLRAPVTTTSVLLYRKPIPAPQLLYPIFTPFKRRVKALGQKVAPVIAVGGGGVGMDLNHALGLSLLKLGGLKF